MRGKRLVKSAPAVGVDVHEVVGLAHHQPVAVVFEFEIQSADVGASLAGAGMHGSMKPVAGRVTLKLVARHFMAAI